VDRVVGGETEVHHQQGRALSDRTDGHDDVIGGIEDQRPPRTHVGQEHLRPPANAAISPMTPPVGAPSLLERNPERRLGKFDLEKFARDECHVGLDQPVEESRAGGV
jgi:hypothetical protein